MNTSGLFSLTSRDFLRGLGMAIITGILLPLSAAVQTPGFSITAINWQSVLVLAINGAVVGFLGYLVHAFSSDNSGKLAGKI